jgi:UDP:flavonoid glycosyltransferase YjiC (YdhE family)
VPRWSCEPRSRRRICVTGGISRSLPSGSSDAAADAAAVLPPGELAAALAELDLEVVLAVSAADRDRLGPLPANVRVAVMLPLAVVLPGCDLLVSRGGNGSVMTAAAAGVPQLCVPGQPADQHSAQALAATGAGLVLDPREATAASIRAAAARVLTEPGFRHAATGLRTAMAQRPDPARAVTVIEGLVASHRVAAER